MCFIKTSFFKEMCLERIIEYFLQGNVIKEHFLKKNELFHQRSKGLGTLEELMKRRRMIGPAVAEAKLVD